MSESCYPAGLIGVDEAVARLVALARESVPSLETLPLAQAAGRVLAADLVAPLDVPPEANSAMDGFAFRHADLPASGELPLSQRIPAGIAPAPLVPGTAARIFTGAIIPAGADTVVMQEHCDYDDRRVVVARVPAAGANIRPAGQDIARGQVVLARGMRLTPPAIGVVASLGLACLEVYRPLRIALLCTGDELLAPGEPWRPGCIYNSNRPMLAALLAGWGFEVIDLGQVADSQQDTEGALANAVASGADVILSTGGVSVGEEDHVKAAVQRRGRLDFWKVAIKPGKPVAVGEVSGVPFIGLPGNPQSVFVTALVLARPFLLARQGCRQLHSRSARVSAGFATRKAADRDEYLRVRLEEGAEARVVPHPQQSSGALASAVWADGLALVPAGVQVKEGDILRYLGFEALLAG
ncbi:MAG: gephyrin-like molybdotransferase Glp [Pseudomonadota bacterium]